MVLDDLLDVVDQLLIHILTLIRFFGVRADPKEIKTVGISQQDMIQQRIFK